MNVIDRRSAETRKHVVARFAAMGAEDQVLVLVRLANRLSLMARETYAAGGGVSDSDRLRRFNEAENRILAQTERLVMSDSRRYPDDVFADILCDQFEMLDLDPEVLLGTFDAVARPGSDPKRLH